MIYVNQTEDKLYVKALTDQAKKLNVTNMLGQSVRTYNTTNNQTLENGIDIANLNSGVYIVSIQTENNISIDKKIVIN
ncbi:MAG: T9SS type A sorting domain-containing protein [Flavobacteriaceae bacterium]|nr:T9SS type A sorting domain-containing protein [Flavobacteriaceae bacterium]